jgi:hypothetical protein
MIFKVKPVAEIAAAARAKYGDGDKKPNFLLRSFSFKLLLVLTALLIVGVIAGFFIAAEARVRTGQVAMQLCSCLYVANRDYESCMPEVSPVAKDMRITFGREAAEARYFGLAIGVAQLEPGYGCHLKKPTGLVQRALSQ